MTYIGTDFPRPDAAEKVAGRAVYIHDVVRPGMLYGKIKYSDYAHARIVHIDTSKASRLPGVRTVITAENTPEVRFGFIRDNFVMKRTKVRQYRDEVAAVAAVDRDTAAEAVELIRVEYEPLPGLFTPEAALEPGAPLIHETDPKGRQKRDNIVEVPWKLNAGDTAAGREASAFVAEDTLTTPLIQQSCMGTAGCVAEFDLNNNLLIHTKTQIPFLAQNDFIRALSAMGLKGKNARVIVPVLGGAFGTGLDTHGYEYISILLAYMAGRPVKIVMTREEEFSYLSPRQPTKTWIAQGCDAEGKLTFREIRMLLDNGAYTSWGATTPSVMMLPVSSLYRVPNIHYETQIVYTNNTYCQAMRGYGNPQATWAVETNMDRLAEAAGIDPLDFRLINRNVPDDVTPMGLVISTCGHKECLETVAGRLNWRDKRKREGKTARGMGMASLFHVGGSGRVYRSDGSGVILKLDDFGNVTVYIGGVEMGQGLLSAVTLATADALGVTPDKVTVIHGDTAVCPWDVGTHASRGAFTACNAVIEAARKAKEKIFQIASLHFMPRVGFTLEKRQRRDPDFVIPDRDYQATVDPEDFELQDNVVFLKWAPVDPILRVPLDELIREAHFKEQGTMIVTDAFYDPCNEMLDARVCRGNISATYIFGVQGAEVEVDVETGKVRILLIAAAHDVGKVLNQQTLRGQFYGGIIQGVGYALTEEIKTAEGKIQNPDFTDYKILSPADVDFPIYVDFIETDDMEGPFGAKGVGEPGLVPTAPAVANAVYDAVGVRIRDLPVTPEKVLAALREKAKEENR